jgi:hypothetical protein
MELQFETPRSVRPKILFLVAVILAIPGGSCFNALWELSCQI